MGWVGELISGIASVTGSITTAVSAGAVSRREAETARLQITAEREAAAEARQWAFQEAQLQQSTRMAEIDLAREELEVLREQAEAATSLQAQADSGPVIVGASGSDASTTLWIVGGLAGLLGLGVVVGGIYFATKKKD
jgi:hypothetical protein